MTMEATSAGFDLAGMIKSHQAGVWRYLRVLGCSAAEADDLTQDTFLAVWQRPFQEYSPTATAAYLRTVARNLFITSQRRNARWVAMTELDDVDTAWSRWAGDDGGQTLLLALEACLQTLAERARRALDLRFREQRSRTDIAATIGLSEDGAKNLMQRAKQHLRECIERRLP
jgi:RNA polymerase sigma-70 factor (ECF subfamily)